MKGQIRDRLILISLFLFVISCQQVTNSNEVDKRSVKHKKTDSSFIQNKISNLKNEGFNFVKRKQNKEGVWFFTSENKGNAAIILGGNNAKAKKLNLLAQDFQVFMKL